MELSKWKINEEMPNQKFSNVSKLISLVSHIDRSLLCQNSHCFHYTILFSHTLVNLSFNFFLYLKFAIFIISYLFFNINLFVNWRLITLQYCIGFAIYQHGSTKGIHVLPILSHPPTPYHPSGSSQCTSPKYPVSCIEPGLAIHFIYDIIHISMPFSQIIPPSPSPTESNRLFYTSVSLLLSRIQGYCYHLSKFHIYALVYYIGIFLSGLFHSV